MGEERGRALGMPLDQFTEEAYKGLVENQEQVIVGVPGPTAKEDYAQLLKSRQVIFDSLSDMIMTHFN